MHDEPQEPPSGLQQELAEESSASLPAPTKRFATIGTLLAWTGFILTAFYTYVPSSSPLAFRVLLNAGVVLVGVGLTVIILGLADLHRPPAVRVA